ETGKTYVLKHLTISDDVNLLVLSTCYSSSNAVTTRLNLKLYCDIDVCVLKTDFPELRIKKYHGKSDPVEKAHDFSNVKETWMDVDLVAYTSTLKIGVSCTNPKFEWAFCLFNSFIETNAGTNQMLFHMRCIKDYICHIEQRSSNVSIIEKELFQWLLNAKRECLPQELQNRGIFSDIDSIIRNKDVPTIRLWVAFILEKFRSQRLFGWRMIDFLKETAVKANSSIIKAEEISDISNVTILDRETAEFLENKPKKTLDKMWSLE
ncbi:9075_t:CDS:2, partial [Funneliformis geosporum]